jgi:hypothetical protein
MVALTLAASACGVDTTKTEVIAPEVVLELRAYDVPEGQADRVVSMLKRLVAKDDTAWRVTRGPGNKVVVVAAPPMLDSVEAFLSTLDFAETGTVPSSHRLDYWLVLARPGKTGERAAALKEISGPLDAFADSQGAASFELLDRIALRSMDGEYAEARGKVAKVEQRASKVGSRVVANVEAELSGSKVSTQLQLEPGQTAVLAQVGFDEKIATQLRGGPDELSPDRSALVLLYIVRAAVEE